MMNAYNPNPWGDPRRKTAIWRAALKKLVRSWVIKSKGLGISSSVECLLNASYRPWVQFSITTKKGGVVCFVFYFFDTIVMSTVIQLYNTPTLNKKQNVNLVKSTSFISPGENIWQQWFRTGKLKHKIENGKCFHPCELVSLKPF